MRSVPRRRLVAGLLLAPLLSGCFASSGGETSSSASADGARLRVALAFPPAENLSPYGADATILSRLGVTEGLTALDANGTAIPALAESWTRENDRSWLFTLREATFQDGTAVTPSAVAAALTHAAEAKVVPAALTGVELTAKATGDDRIRVTTADPDPVLPLRLASPGLAVLSTKAYAKQGAVSPVGTATGPFELTAATGTTTATLDRFDDYWGGRAQASGIDAKFIADGTARTNALRTGRWTSPRRSRSPRPPPSTRASLARRPRPAPPAFTSTPSPARSRTRGYGPRRVRRSTPRCSPRASTKGTPTPAPASSARP